MSARNYINGSPGATLSSAITSGQTVFSISSSAGLPAVPFMAVLDIGSGSSEVILVTAITGSSVTATRNADGRGSLTHVSGSSFTHAAVAADYQEANAHINANANVHGATGAVVGTTNTQTLTNKTLTSPTINTPTITNPTINSGATVNGGATVAGGLTVTGGDITLSGGHALLGSFGVQARVSAALASITRAGDGTLTVIDGNKATWAAPWDASNGAFSTAVGTFTVPSGKAGNYLVSGMVGVANADQAFFCQGAILVNGVSAHTGPISVSPGPLTYPDGGNGTGQGLNWGLNNALTATIPARVIQLSAGDAVRLGISAWMGDGGPTTYHVSSGIASCPNFLVIRVN